MIDRHREVYGINEELANQILLRYKPDKKEEDNLQKRLEKLEKKHNGVEKTFNTNNSDLNIKTLSPSLRGS